MSEQEVDKCPICSSDVERGCVMGNLGNSGAFRWFPGEPSTAKSVLGIFMLGSEDMGTFEMFKGAYMKGSRCTKCRKLFLTY